MPSKIEWTNETWNPVTGCTKVSAGCKNCYAETFFKRFNSKQPIIDNLRGDDEPGEKRRYRKFTDVQVHPERLAQPLHWKKSRMVFVDSMGDLFHPDVPDMFIMAILAVIESCPQHIFQVLTKRPGRMLKLITLDNYAGYQRKAGIDVFPKKYNQVSEFPMKNLWLGVSVEDQETADERISFLLQTPAAVRWISAEPLLAEIDIEEYLYAKELDWVVVGGESGPKARPMHPDWVRYIRDQCQVVCNKSSVPFFFKQWGEWAFCDSEEEIQTAIKTAKDYWYPFDDEVLMMKVGKKKAGNLLDGIKYQEYPK